MTFHGFFFAFSAFSLNLDLGLIWCSFSFIAPFAVCLRTLGWDHMHGKRGLSVGISLLLSSKQNYAYLSHQPHIDTSFSLALCLCAPRGQRFDVGVDAAVEIEADVER